MEKHRIIEVHNEDAIKLGVRIAELKQALSDLIEHSESWAGIDMIERCKAILKGEK